MTRSSSAPETADIHTLDALLDAYLEDLRTVAEPGVPAHAVINIDQLDSWTLPAPTALAPTTICWVGGKPGRDPGVAAGDTAAGAVLDALAAA